MGDGILRQLRSTLNLDVQAQKFRLLANLRWLGLERNPMLTIWIMDTVALFQ